MARLQLSKAALAKEEQKLGSYERFLPSLDLKRQQLTAVRAKAVEAIKSTQAEIESFKQEVGKSLPMLANKNIDLTDIVKVTGAKVTTENVVGARLPRLENIDVEVRPYALMGKPHWVDRLVELLRQMLELRIRQQVEERRLVLLDAAVRTVTQRVNLFDKVLIPQTKKNIKRIEIYLGDAERDAVVRSKLAKGKHKKDAAA